MKDLTGQFFSKQDRLSRLIRLAYLLYTNPTGLTIDELSHRVDRTRRTVYRDLLTLDLDLGIPVLKDGKRWRADGSAFLPPLKLTAQEAVALFLSARLAARFSDKRDDHLLSMFRKLATIAPTGLARQVEAAAGDLAEAPRNDLYQAVLTTLADCWVQGTKVRLRYPRTMPNGDTVEQERLVWPYFLEPYPTGHSCYLIGYDETVGAERVFKIERVRNAEATNEPFNLPEGFDPKARLRRPWGVADQDPALVRLLFRETSAVRRVQETRWHPSQRESVRDDGSLQVDFEVNGVLEITPWVLSWGAAVEVLEPTELRERIASTVQLLSEIYGK